MKDNLPTENADLQDELLSQDPEVQALALASLDELSISQVLQGLPVEERVAIWRQLDTSRRFSVLLEMQSESRQLLLSAIAEDEAVELLARLDAEDLVELLADLPDELYRYAVQTLDHKQRLIFEAAIAYPENTAGRIAERSVKVLPQKTRMRNARSLIRFTEDDRFCPWIYLIGNRGEYRGAVPSLVFVGGEAEGLVIDRLSDDVPQIDVHASVEQAVELLEQSHMAALPVVDEGRLIGQLTQQLVVEWYQQQLDARILSQVGKHDGEDLFAPVLHTVKGRSAWLGINLLTAFLAAWTIGLFEETLERLVALAVLMPIVASMGGIAGSQTLALMMRGLALGQICPASVQPLSVKELRVGILNAVLWSTVIGLSVFWWFESIGLGLVIAGAITVNLLCAAYAAVWVPVILHRLKLDPALSGSVVLTTVTDVVGFFTLLALGSLLL